MKRIVLTLVALSVCIGLMQTSIGRGTTVLGRLFESSKDRFAKDVMSDSLDQKVKQSELKVYVEQVSQKYSDRMIKLAFDANYINESEAERLRSSIKELSEKVDQGATEEVDVFEVKDAVKNIEEIAKKIPENFFGRAKRWIQMNPGKAALIGVGAGLVGGYLAHKYKLPEKGWSAGKAGAGLGWRGLKGGAGLAGRGVVGGARLAGRGVAGAGKGIAGGARLAGRGVAGGARLVGRSVIGTGRLTGRGLYGAGKLAGRGAAGVGRGVAGSARFAGRGIIGVGKLTGKGLYGAGSLAGRGITGGAGLGWRGIKGLAGGAWGLTKGGARGVWGAGKFIGSAPRRLATSPEAFEERGAQIEALTGRVATGQEQLAQQQAQQAALQGQIAAEQAAKQQLQRQLEATKKQEEGFAQELFQEKQKSLWELAKERWQNYGR